jgi:hypothetical protein
MVLVQNHLECADFGSEDSSLMIVLFAQCSNRRKSDEEEDFFYDDLDKICGQCPRRDVKIITGDINGKIGKEDTYRPIIGKYS